MEILLGMNLLLALLVGYLSSRISKAHRNIMALKGMSEANHALILVLGEAIAILKDEEEAYHEIDKQLTRLFKEVGST